MGTSFLRIFYTYVFDQVIFLDFNFHITHFLFPSIDIPYSPAYGVFNSQLMQFAFARSFDNRAIADRLSWSNYSHQTSVVNRFTVLTFSLPARDVESKGHTFINIPPYIDNIPTVKLSGYVIKIYVQKSIVIY